MTLAAPASALVPADLAARMPRPRIGLLATGHSYYWEQFPRLRRMGAEMLGALRQRLEAFGDVTAPELVDDPDSARRARAFFAAEQPDIILIFPVGYTPGMNVLPALEGIEAPIRIINAHEDRTYDYRSADTTVYLHHEGVCCIPEYCAGLMRMGRRFTVRTGAFADERLWRELRADIQGAAAARAFRQLGIGLLGETYTGMVDMPTDEHRVLKATGRMLVRPEVEEIEDAYERADAQRTRAMVAELRGMYEVEPSVDAAALEFAARLAVAYDEVIRRHDISAFGYYWWGAKPFVTQLRAQSALAVSRLAALGRPGVTEGDVKTAMAMKVLDLLGAGGMFLEFFSMDFESDFLLMGHDGPCNIAVREGRASVQNLDVHHGKSGHGIGIDFEVRKGPATLLNLSQLDAGDTFKLVYASAEVIPGEILHIGNPNCRVRVGQPIHRFIDRWCQQGTPHHLALGLGDHGQAIEAFGEAMGFPVVRV